MKKTFKIGEYCTGGIIQIIKTKTRLKVLNLDYFSKEVLRTREHIILNPLKDNSYIIGDIYNFLIDLTTSYYSNKIIKFIKNELEGL